MKRRTQSLNEMKIERVGEDWGRKSMIEGGRDRKASSWIEKIRDKDSDGGHWAKRWEKDEKMRVIVEGHWDWEIRLAHLLSADLKKAHSTGCQTQGPWLCECACVHLVTLCWTAHLAACDAKTGRAFFHLNQPLLLLDAVMFSYHLEKWEREGWMVNTYTHARIKILLD